MSTTFNWTELREAQLVGFDGEDLGIEGIDHHGNLVEVDNKLLVRADGDDAPQFRCIDGALWTLRRSQWAAMMPPVYTTFTDKVALQDIIPFVGKTIATITQGNGAVQELVYNEGGLYEKTTEGDIFTVRTFTGYHMGSDTAQLRLAWLCENS